MSGIGLLMAFFGYVILYWALQAIQSHTQAPFFSYIFPWGK